MFSVFGKKDSLLLVLQEDKKTGVIVDTDFGVVVDAGSGKELHQKHSWSIDTQAELSPELSSLVAATLAREDKKSQSAGRLYTIPKSVQTEAFKALEWYKKYGRGGSPAGLRTATILAGGGQIPFKQVKNIADHFNSPVNRLEVITASYSYDDVPPNEVIGKAMWGGDFGKKWSTDVVKSNYKEDPDTFEMSIFDDFDPSVSIIDGPEFIARVRLDGSGIDRLYKVDIDGSVYVWDNGLWDDLGSIDGDIWTYDKALDSPYDRVQKSHIVVDPESAIKLAARFDARPFTPVSVFELDEDEANFMINSVSSIDHEFFRSLTAAMGANPAANEGPQKTDMSDVLRKTVPAEEVAVKLEDEDSSPLGAEDLHDVLRLWDAWVASSRASHNEPKVSVSEVHSLIRQQKARKKFGSFVKVKDHNWAKSVTSAATPPAEADTGAPVNPENSDVEPLYIAIVADDDPAAVLQLVAITPKTDELSSPMTYKRENNKWVKDEKILEELRSSTPPPVVALNESVLVDVLRQIDSLTAAVVNSSMYLDRGFMVLFGPNPEMMAITAAGGLDRNRGNAERLRHYWTRGAGALRIRWGTPGDWKRCVRYLSKHLGPRAKGYCQLRHKEATGIYTGDRMNPGNRRNRRFFSVGDEIVLTASAVSEIPAEDLELSLEEILASKDPLYSESWSPPQEIIYDMDAIAENQDEYMEERYEDRYGDIDDIFEYWIEGPGAIKIAWGEPGDWSRCVRHISKYVGSSSNGICAMLAKEVSESWVGDDGRRELLTKRREGSPAVFSTDVVKPFDSVVDLYDKLASISDSKDRMLGITASGVYDSAGPRFVIPLVLPEEVDSGDGRKFRKNSITIRELPLPLLWQTKTADGHMGSVVVGRIDHMERTPEGIGNAYGVFDTGPYAREVQRLVKNRFIRGISADLDQFEAEDQDKKEASDKENRDIKKDKILINKARVMAITIVPKPAFQECTIQLETLEPNEREGTVSMDGVYVEDLDPIDAAAIVACGAISQAIPLAPPSNWFDNPNLTGPTPLTITDDGRVYGHIAAWDTDHIGLPFGTKPPRSRSNYAYFQTGVVRTSEGTDVPVGQLTLAGGHASLEASAAEAIRHYDDTASAFADVKAGEDGYGIWVSGALRPGTTPEQIRAIRASAPSGDWRPIRGALELVAVCQVNVPGFPVARARVASGAVMALVAAGASTLARMKNDPISELNSRIEALESMQNSSSSVDEDMLARARELSSRVDLSVSYLDSFASFTRDERKALALRGQALPDGSYPIRNVEDLKNAIQAFGRSKKSKRSDVRKHIMKQAKRLRRSDLIPEEWRDTMSSELAQTASLMREKAAVIAAASPKKDEPLTEEEIAEYIETGRVAGRPAITEEDIKATPGMKLDRTLLDKVEDGRMKYTPGINQPRDEAGRFRRVLARLKQDLGTAGLQNIVEEAKYIEGLHELGSYAKAAEAAGHLIDTVERLDEGALNKVSLENIRKSTTQLGQVIANLPLGSGLDYKKLRYSDAPPALQKLIKEMINRVEAKIGPEDAAIATKAMKEFMSGSEVYSQPEISAEMNKLLRLLT